MKQPLDNQRAVSIANLPRFGIVYVIVTNAANVRLGDDPGVLQNDKSDGIPINNAIPAQQSFVWWGPGKLWAISDIPTNVSVFVTGMGALTGR